MKNITESSQGVRKTYSFLLAAIVAFASAFAAHATSLKWDGGGDGVNFSDPLNWEGDVAPAAGSDSYRLEFNGAANGKSLVNDIEGLAATNIIFGSNATSPVTISGHALTDCVKILNSSTAHHIFECEVVCRSGITPSIPIESNNYPKFQGGISATWFATGSAAYWSGKFKLNNSSRWAMGRVTLNLVDKFSSFTANEVGIDRLWVPSSNLAITTRVSKISNDGSQYRYSLNGQNWSYRWMLAAGQLPAGSVVRTGSIVTSSSCPELYHSYATSSYGDSGIIIVNSVTNGTTGLATGSTDQVLPWIYLSRGYRSGSSRYAQKSGTWAIGPGGLNFSSNANNDSTNGARYRVGEGGAYLHSFADWTLALHRTSANVALQFVDSGVLTIDTDHYTVGEAEYDTVDRHNVTIRGRVYGTGAFVARGAGSVSFMGTSDLSGTLTATSGVSIAIGASARPCTGAIAMHEGTSLVFPNAGTGTTAALGAISFAGNNTVVFSNLTSGVTAANASKLTFSDPATTTFAIEGESALAPGLYQLFALTGGVAPDMSNVAFGGTALEGVEYEILANKGGVSIYVPGEFDVEKPQMVKPGAMSDAANWLGMKKPSTDALNAEIVFLPSVTSAVNDMDAIPVTKISFQATVPVTVSGTGKFTEVTTIATSASVHHTLGCKVECKNGVTPTIPNAENNYVKFTGGLVTPTLAKPTNFGGAACYYMGKISITNSSWEVNLSRDNSSQSVGVRVHILGGSEISAKTASLNFVNIYSNAVFTVQNLTAGSRWYADANSSKYMGNWGSAGPWKVYWTRLAETCNGKIVVTGSINPGSGKDCFLPEGTASNRVVIAKGIVNSSTTATTGAYTAAPYIFLNRGNKTTNGSAYGLANSTGEFKIALGSGGLSVKSGANSGARFIVGADNTICSYENWALAAHPTSGNAALTIESSKTLTIDTGHYAVGDSAIDDGATTHTVTVNGVIGGAGNLRIVGGGTVAFNSVCTHSGWTRVEDGVAIIKSGARPAAGTFSVWGSGTMDRKDRGTVTLGGGLIVGDNSTLKFTINDNTDTNKLVASYISNTIKTANTFVNVYVDAPGGQFLRGFTPYTLITVTGDTKLSAEDLSKYKLQDKPTWASRLDIVGGNLVLWPRAPGLSLSVR